MPQLGEIRRGIEIGSKSHNNKYIWHACIDCGKERWVWLARGEPCRLRCRHCCNLGERSGNWRGGRYKDEVGYIRVMLYPDNPFYEMAENYRGKRRRYVMEHRIVMAKHLNRCLTRDEKVHHINGIKDDNRIENLELISLTNHYWRTIYCRKCPVRKEVKQLRAQLLELTQSQPMCL